MGRVKGECLYSYFVRRFYVFRYPTAHSHPCKLTSEIITFVRCGKHYFVGSLHDHPYAPTM